MSDFDAIKSDAKTRMDKTLETLKADFSGLRAGRAHASLLDGIMVEAYGSMTPLSQVGTISVPGARTLSVSFWDRSMAKAVEKAIRESDLGLNPASDGQLIRIPIPPLSEERRKELVKVAGKYTEAAKVAVRNIRRDALDGIKKLKKELAETRKELTKTQKKLSGIQYSTTYRVARVIGFPIRMIRKLFKKAKEQ